ncbi:MAG TPA: MFS transporter [Candidatus Dormibacteraeota bacterium]|nr:MFS transporter [Candidatus Dormibacteraeota bacterium]
MPLRRAVADLNWSYALVGIADGTLLTFVPLFLFRRGFDPSLIGVVLAASAAGSLIAGLGWSYLADRSVRPERILIGSSAAAAVVALLIAAARGTDAVAVAIVALWVARAPFMLLDPMALRRLEGTGRARYGRMRLRMSAGWAVSVVAAGALYQVLGVQLAPWLYAPLAALFGLWTWRSLRRSLAAPATIPPPTTTRRPERLPIALLGFLASVFLLGAAMAATQNFLTLRIDVLGGGALLVGAAASFQALTEIPTMGYMHLLTKRVSHKTLFAVGCATYMAMFLAWAFVSDPFAAALIKLVAGVAFAFVYVSSVIIADELSPSHLRATSQALVKSVMFGLAPIVGALLGGLVYQNFGARAMFLGSIAVVCAAGAIALAVVRPPAPAVAVMEPAPAET